MIPQDIKFKITSKRLPYLLLAFKITARKLPFYPVHLLVRYYRQGDWVDGTTHMQAFSWDDLEIECLTEKAKDELIAEKGVYEILKKSR